MLDRNNSEIIKGIYNLLRKKDYLEIKNRWIEYKSKSLLHYSVARAFQVALENIQHLSDNDESGLEDPKFLTVVTINYNNLRGLKETVESVLGQTKIEDIQYVVVDGGSTDGSLSYLTQMSEKIDLALYGKDAGIYDAMNRGLGFSDSKYTLFLNSGDCFVANNVVEEVEKKIGRRSDSPIAAYGTTLTSSGARWPVKPVGELWKGMICSHQSILIDTVFLKSIGFDTKRSIVSDYETIYKASLAGDPMIYLNTDISRIEDVGVSADFQARTLERWQVVRSVDNQQISREEIDDFYLNLLVKESNKHLAGGATKSLKTNNVEKIGDRLIFLISMPRSGSTMLQKILERCPSIGTVGEPWVMLPLVSMYDDEMVEARYGQTLCKKAGEEFLKAIDDKELFLKARRRYAEAIYDSALTAVGKPRFLDKTPRYVHIVEKLAELFPSAKFVVLLRNPAAIISSYAHTWAGGDYNVVVNNPEYMYDFQHGFRNLGMFVQSDSKNFHVVRYEALVENPEHEAKALYEYLELPFSDNYVNYGKAIPKDGSKYAFGDPSTVYSKSRPDAAHTEKWISQNETAKNLHLFKGIMNDLSEEVIHDLGYVKTRIVEQVSEIETGNLIDLSALVERYSSVRPCLTRPNIPRFDKSLGVLITCYNNSGTIIPALKSVLSQSKKPDLVLIADDASIDGSAELVQDFLRNEGIDNVKLTVREKNMGVAKNRDLAIRDMDVDFISTLDGDDLYFPGKLEAEWLVLRGRLNYLAFSDILMCLENKKNLLLDTSAYDKLSRTEVAAQLLSRSNPVPRDMTFSRELYISTGGFDHGVSIYEDWGLKQRLALAVVDHGWLHSGCIGTVYDRRNPGLSGKPKVVHALGELAMMGRNIKELEMCNKAVLGGLKSIVRHLSGQMRERALNFIDAYPAEEDEVPLYVRDSLRFLWQERTAHKTTDDIAKAIWHFFGPVLKSADGVLQK